MGSATSLLNEVVESSSKQNPELELEPEPKQELVQDVESEQNIESKTESVPIEVSSEPVDEQAIEKQINDLQAGIIPKDLTFLKIGSLVFPELSSKELDRILWNKTGFPSFFKPKEGQNVAQVCLEQLLQYKDNVVNKKDCCYCCGDVFDVSSQPDYNYFNPDLCQGKTKCRLHT